ncbi:MAG: NAD(P)/FAD-dependent oxidoreductase [Saccharofermentanales bacterium]
MRKHSVIIVGGGLGGATCAFFCSKLGLDVLMVEKDQFPRDKICGDGLQAPMYPILKEMGILDDVLAVSFPNKA